MRKLDLTNEHQATGLANLNHIMAVCKKMRIANGWSQKYTAELAGISVSTLSKYERGLFPTRVVWAAALVHSLGFRLSLDLMEERWIASEKVGENSLQKI